MQFRTPRPLLTAAALFVSGLLVGGRVAVAQTPPTRPTPTQAQELLRNRPELAAQIQQRLLTSGMTPQQVRARLRAEGYPESLLDAYLPGGGGRSAADTTSNATLIDAVRALGIVDSTDVEMLGRQAGLVRLADDTTFAPLTPDTTRLRGELRADSADARRRTGADTALRIFGRDLFTSRTNVFEPNAAGPVDANYRLGPGDRLVLILTGDVEVSHILDVTREGFVVIPQVGQLFVANLTLGQLEDLLYSRLGRVFSGVQRGANARTRFSISVARLRSNQVFVVGDVERPASYRVSSAGTALTALYAAGGPTTTGSLRRIEIRRGGRVVGRLDLYDYLLRGDAARDVRLETGDVVFVPPHQGRVRVYGEVVRPAIYEIQTGETLADVLQAAGGFEATASQRRVQIERILPTGERTGNGRERVLIDVQLDGSVDAARAMAMRPGDAVRVFRVDSRVHNRARVIGNVWAPGVVAIRPGMRLSEVLRAAGGVKPDTYLGQVLVSRLRPDSSREVVRAALRDTTGAVVNDPAMLADDEIRVFSVTEFRPTRYVAIGGAVRRGGQFRYREGMTLRDLVLLAGGLEESALLNEAEVARLPEDRRNGVTARTFRVPLDSSYLFERAPDGRYSGPPGVPAPSGTAPEVVLKPYDNVLVLRQPDFELQRRVYIGGEVRFPGTYALRIRTERLGDLVTRAGGLTSEAYAAGIEFHRVRDSLGRVGVDLPAVIKSPRHRDNLILVDGDSIVIPNFNPVVTVTGAVNAPVSVAYVPGQDLNYYVRSAGGPSATADARRAYVIQPNGKLQSIQRRRYLPDGVPSPQPGGRVVVPERPKDQPQRDLLATVTVLMQVLGTLGALVATIVAVRRN